MNRIFTIKAHALSPYYFANKEQLANVIQLKIPVIYETLCCQLPCSVAALLSEGTSGIDA